MSIPCRLYTLLIEFSVFGFHREFLLSIFIAFILMDPFTCLNHLIHDPGLRYGFLVFKISKEVSVILCLLLLFVLGFKALYSPSIRGSVQFLCDLRRNSGKFKKDIFSEKVLDRNCYSDCHRNISRELDREYDVVNDNEDEDEECYSVDEDELRGDEDGEFDVSRLRKLVKVERGRANAAVAELVKERAASGSAAEEAMAMILRLQHEKSSIEMELSQYKRLAEEKQIHDHQVIQSLQWLVWRNETEMNSLQEELNRFLKSGDESESAPSEKNVVENVFCSSLDFNLSLK